MGLRSIIKRLMGQSGPIIPVVRLQGVIAADQRPGRLNIETVAPLLKRAFAIKSAPAVAIIINSPGGSPVQSRLISKRIRDLADEHNKPVLVFVEDAAASGGYFIAVAGDEIIADPSSIVGSIGVIFSGFGFVEAIGKLGVERRVHTAGRNKSTLDPFLPEKPEDIARINQLETDIHKVFIDWVKLRRGARLKAPDDDALHRRVLVRRPWSRSRPRRPPGRPARNPPRPLRRQGRTPRHRPQARPLQPATARHGAASTTSKTAPSGRGWGSRP